MEPMSDLKDTKTVGFVGGKYLPFHQGHVYMIMAASNLVDKLYVVLCSGDKRDKELCERDGIKYMPSEVRMSWIGKTLNDLDNVEVINVKDDYSESEYDTKGWEEGSIAIIDAIPEKITHVFSSEHEYGEHFSKYYPEAEHIVIDSGREVVNISATEIRKDIYKHWNMLPDSVRSFFTKKVVIMGTESCGKSTLAKKLSKFYNTNYVHEVGRDYCVEYNDNLTVDMFDSIAMEHMLLTEKKLKESNKILFIDSEALITQYYLNMYFDTQSFLIDQIIRKQDFDLILYAEPDVPWVDDGFRSMGEPEVRRDNNVLMKKMMMEYSNMKNYYSISGTYEERFGQARALVENML